jgi:imidazoleglycerol-phosphate dehydratase
VRSGVSERTTTETNVAVTIELDGSGRRDIATGVRMLDHLLEQLAFHSRCNLRISARSLDDIQHHLVEDVALALGEAIAVALGERRGIERYGSALIPMDDALARVAIDLSGRPFARIDLALGVERIEGLDCVLIAHFFRSLASKSGMTLHVDLLCAADPHHAVEASFKAFARALAVAWSTTAAGRESIPSTKGTL